MCRMHREIHPNGEFTLVQCIETTTAAAAVAVVDRSVGHTHHRILFALHTIRHFSGKECERKTHSKQRRAKRNEKKNYTNLAPSTTAEAATATKAQ